MQLPIPLAPYPHGYPSLPQPTQNINDTPIVVDGSSLFGPSLFGPSMFGRSLIA